MGTAPVDTSNAWLASSPAKATILHYSLSVDSKNCGTIAKKIKLNSSGQYMEER
jgi:hypothetical protein